MHNPRYHSFSPRIAGTWSLRRYCVWIIFQHPRQRLTLHALHLMTWAHEPAACAPTCAVGTQAFLQELEPACGLQFCGSVKSSADLGLEREPENPLLKLSFLQRRYSLQLPSSFQATFSFLANLCPGPSAHIQSPGSSHDAPT